MATKARQKPLCAVRIRSGQDESDLLHHDALRLAALPKPSPLAKKYQGHRRTVREALTSALPPAPRKKPPPRSSRLDPFKPVIDQILWTDLDAPRKQRHTVRRIFKRLVAEREMEGISYSAVANYVVCRKPQIMAEAGRGSPPEVPIDQVHQPGVEAEVNFGDVWINLAGTMA
ncbi:MULTISPECIES: hypothetical protein [Thermomonosporaceae]|uniref:hypothetical protein n=1 Tax=Thermomonosporaceae TaxID=2012 RepID=UPI00255AB7F5|nr:MULTISPECIES: hypothetical protein [Thermomonosporaceae]MDL4776770.1 hypothetical protein [Actinomadura xylanilytica]